MTRMLAPLIALAALPAVTASAAAQAPVAPLAPLPPEATLLEVSAEGRTTRVPDVAMVNAGVVTTAPTAAAAFSANAEQMAKVLAALDKAGIAKRDTQTASVQLQPQYRYENNRPPVLTGYQATNSVNVKLRDVARGGRVVDALVQAGANQVSGPTLTIDEPDAALDEARADAIKRARARADLYAKAAGLTVARILSISEDAGSYQPAPPPMVMMRAAAPQMADTEMRAGEQDVTVRVAVRFVLR